MASRIIQGDVFSVLPTLAPGSVDAVVTSPPYWQLRAYLGKDHPLKKYELGSEPTPAEFVRRMVEVFGLVREVMSDHGTLWLNVGDSYSSKPVGRFNGGGAEFSAGRDRSGHATSGEADKTLAGIPEGNLCLIPQRLMIALQDAGWIVRSVVVWAKPSCMPQSLSGWAWKKCRVKVKEGGRGGNGKARMLESGTSAPDAPRCTDAALAQWQDCPGCKRCEANAGLVLRRGSWRPTSSWEPVVMLAKGSGYYADGIAVQTPGAVPAGTVKAFGRRVPGAHGLEELTGNMADGATWDTTGTANPRDVLRTPLEDMSREELLDLARALTEDGQARDLQSWSSEPLKSAHYAAFPSALPMWCLRAGTSSKGYCPVPSCGKPWVRVVETKFYGDCRAGRRDMDAYEGKHEWRGTAGVEDYQPPKTIGWKPSCQCIGAETFTPRPGLVLDPFCGSGRVGIAAQRLGLDFVGVELHPEYHLLAQRILREDAPLFS